MRLVAAFASAVMLICFGVSPGHTQTRVALVMGNSAYQNVPALPNPTNDASDMAASLERLGFKVRRVPNGTFDDMRRALRDFAAQARQSEMAVVFYAGHGMEIGGENWLIPVDAELKIDIAADQEAVALRSILAIVGGASRLGLVILDACRNNGRNSPFTAALLRHLETPGLEINYLFRGVREEVFGTTNPHQEPVVYGALPKAEIYLKPPANSVAVVSVPAKSEATRPAVDVAAQAWAGVKDTTSLAVIEAFIEQYGDSIYGRFARARRDELKRSQSMAVPAGGQGQVSAPPKTNLALTFEQGVDRAGNTILELNLSSPDARLCQSMCIKEARCTAWVYRAPEGRTDRLPHCWLRNNVTKGPHDSATISGDVPR